MRPHVLRPRALLCVFATLALAACGGREIPTPVERFADAGRYVMVDEVSRPVLSAPRVFHVAPACTPGVGLAPGACSVAVPAEAASAPALLLEITRGALDGVLRGAAAPARGALYGQSLPYDLTGRLWRFVARTADAKCMLSEQGDGDCFDLASDPGEHLPLPPSASPRMTALHAAAAAYRERARPEIAAGAAAPFSSGAADALDEATRRKLRALGYVR